MRIAQVCPKYGAQTGGIERIVTQTSIELANRGHDVTIISDHEAKPPVSRGRIRCMVISPLVSFYGFGISPSLVFRLISLNPDVIHVHFNTPISTEFSIVSSIFTHKPVVATYHADSLIDDAQGTGSIARVLGPIYGMVKIIDFKFLSRVFLTSPLLQASRSIGSYDRRKVSIAFPGANHLSHFQTVKPLARSNIGIDSDSRVVLFVGRLVKYKGLEVLMKSLTYFGPSSEIKNLQVYIVGSGPLEDETQRLAKELGVERMVHFENEVTDKRLADFYSAADLLVLPSTSLSEGFGLVLLEAFSFGLPCVATTMGIGPYLLSDSLGGIVIEPNDAHALALAISNILSGRHKTSSKEMRERALRFTWKNYADEIEKGYEETLQGRC